MNNEQQQIIDEVYNNYLNKAKNYTTEDLFYNKLSGVGDVIECMLSAHTRDFIPYSQEEFIDECKTDDEFAKKWGLKIEERELSLEARLLLADKINKEIRQDLYTYAFNNPIYTSGIDQRPDDVERHDLLSDLNIPTRLITITYNDKTIESYEYKNKI
jgi:hypothetical protein